MTAAFVPSGPCWICGGSSLLPIHDNVFELSVYAEQDPALAEYTGASVTLSRCATCGFAQPASLPALPDFFHRMYDQRWAPEWVAEEFGSDAKTGIFAGILDGLDRRVALPPRRLLDVGAHVGKFMAMAAARGWVVEGIELNPTTAAYARQRTGLPVHERPLGQLAREGRRFEAVTLTDVLEHIPEPLRVLQSAGSVLVPGGWLAVKVPCGLNQLRKERARVALRTAPRVSVADNLVHVSHFSPRALALALARAGFVEVALNVGRPERSESLSPPRRALGNAARAAAYAVARILPGGVRSPLAFNLQAFARLPEHAP